MRHLVLLAQYVPLELGDLQPAQLQQMQDALLA
jgi:hypothetical protein